VGVVFLQNQNFYVCAHARAGQRGCKMSVILRPYQIDLVDKIRAAFFLHRRVLAVAPTGAGKTLIFSYITASTMQRGKRIVIIAHRVEICQQISAALDRQGVRHGRIQTGYTLTADAVQVAMVQTLAKRLDRVPEPDLLVIDEAHHATAGTYKKISDYWKKTRILGVTATPERLDGRGLGASFEEMVIGPTLKSLIDQGFLAKYTYLAPPQQVDLSKIKTRLGDYALDQLAGVMNQKTITGDAVEHYRKYLDGKPAIAFCVNVAHAVDVAKDFSASGYRAASVDGKTDANVRRKLIESLGTGELQVLTSCDIVSEGTDIPNVSGAILLRPTKSLGMYLQQVGRVLRLKPDGRDAVILDHVGNIHAHGAPDAQREWSLDGKIKREKPTLRTCDACYQVFDKDTPRCETPLDGCLFEPEQPSESNSPAAKIEHVDGQLEEITNTPVWSGGIDIAKAPFRDVLKTAKTREQLTAVARARGYKRGWVNRILQEREQWRAGS
jgi:superfamily II DNA or RNA helicase